jgi:hypothetical protein
MLSPRPPLEGERRAACACMATLLDLLLGMKRDLVSPVVDALHAECAALFDELNCLDRTPAIPPDVERLRAIAARLIGLHEGLDDITATVLPTCDEVRIRAAGERLMRFSEFLVRLVQSSISGERLGPTSYKDSN